MVLFVGLNDSVNDKSIYYAANIGTGTILSIFDIARTLFTHLAIVCVRVFSMGDVAKRLIRLGLGVVLIAANYVQFRGDLSV